MAEVEEMIDGNTTPNESHDVSNGDSVTGSEAGSSLLSLAAAESLASDPGAGVTESSSMGITRSGIDADGPEDEGLSSNNNIIDEILQMGADPEDVPSTKHTGGGRWANLFSSERETLLPTTTHGKAEPPEFDEGPPKMFVADPPGKASTKNSNKRSNNSNAVRQNSNGGDPPNRSSANNKLSNHFAKHQPQSIHNINSNSRGHVYLDGEDSRSMASSTAGSSRISVQDSKRLHHQLQMQQKVQRMQNQKANQNGQNYRGQMQSSSSGKEIKNVGPRDPTSGMTFLDRPDDEMSVFSEASGSAKSQMSYNASGDATSVVSYNASKYPSRSSPPSRNTPKTTNTTRYAGTNMNRKNSLEKFLNKDKGGDPLPVNENNDESTVKTNASQYSRHSQVSESSAGSYNASKRAIKERFYQNATQRVLNFKCSAFGSGSGSVTGIGSAADGADNDGSGKENSVDEGNAGNSGRYGLRGSGGRPKPAHKVKDSDVETGQNGFAVANARVSFADQIFGQKNSSSSANTPHGNVNSNIGSYKQGVRKMASITSSSQSSSSSGVASFSSSASSFVADSSSRLKNFTENHSTYLKKNAALLFALSMAMCVFISGYYGLIGALNGDFSTLEGGGVGDGQMDQRGLGANENAAPAKGIMHNVHPALKTDVVFQGDPSNNIMGGGGAAAPPAGGVDWSKVPPHLRGYYSKIYGGGIQPQQKQFQQEGDVNNAFQQQVSAADIQQDLANIQSEINAQMLNEEKAKAIQSIGSEVLPENERPQEQFEQQQQPPPPPPPAGQEGPNVPVVDFDEWQRQQELNEGVVQAAVEVSVQPEGQAQADAQAEAQAGAPAEAQAEVERQKALEEELEAARQRQQAEAEEARRQQAAADEEARQKALAADAAAAAASNSVSEMPLPNEAEAEAAKKQAEEEAQRIAEQARIQIEAEEAQRKAAEEEAQRKIAEEAAQQKAEEEAQLKAAEEAQRKAAEEEAQRKAAEEAQLKAAEEARRKAAEEEAKKAAEKEAQLKAAKEQEERQKKEQAKLEEESLKRQKEAEAWVAMKEAEKQEKKGKDGAGSSENAKKQPSQTSESDADTATTFDQLQNEMAELMKLLEKSK